MGTNYIAPTWRMPENNNQSKFDNYSLDFNGTDELIDLGSDTSLNIGGDLTISAWVYVDAHKNFNFIISKFTDASNRNYELYVRNEANVTFVSNSDSTNSTTTIPINTWTHVAVTVQSGVTNGTKFYFNGTLDTTTGTTTVVSQTNATTIGRRSTGSYNFNGKISNVSIFDYTLSESQIKYLYNNNAGGSTPNPQNPMAITGSKPVAYYDLGGNSNPTSNSGYPNLSNENGSVIYNNPPFQSGIPYNLNQHIALNQAFSYPNGFTISFWIKPYIAYGTWGSTFLFHNTSTDSIQRILINNDANGRMYFRVNDQSIGNTKPREQGDSQYGSNFQSGKWYHIVCVYDPNAAFVNTKQKANFGRIMVSSCDFGMVDPSTGNSYNYVYYTAGDGTISPALNLTTENAVLGADALDLTKKDPSVQWSNFAFFDTALPNTGAQSVDSLYNNGTPPDLSSYDNLKVWYPMNSSTSTWNGSDWEIGEAQANYSSALDFDGQNDYMTFSNFNSLAGLNTFSISFWANFNTVALNDTLLMHNVLSGIRVFTENLKMTFKWVSSDGTNVIVKSDNIVPANSWKHYACAYDNTDFKLYENGVLVKTTNQPSKTYKSTPNENLLIGKYWYGLSSLFDGLLSNLSVFNTALDASAISTLYNNGTPETSISGTPENWWKLNNLTTGIQDSAGSNNGTNNGATVENIQVSTLNGVSVNMNTSNLVPTDLFRDTAFSNYSVRLDGATNYLDADVSLGNLLGDDYSGAISFSGWIKCSNLLDQQGIFSICKENSSGQEFSIFIDYTGTTPYLYIDVDGYGDSETAANVGLVQGEWAHIVWVYQQSDSTSDVYVNGVLTSIAQTVFRSPDLNSKKTFLGNYYSSSSPKPFNGEISNFAVWNQKLTSDNVNELYNKAIPQDISSFSPAPIRWWPMDGSNIYYNGSEIVTRELKNNNSATGVNTATSDIVGEAPGSEANGTGSNITITNLKGDMANSINNSISINMADYASGTNPANSGRSTNVP